MSCPTKCPHLVRHGMVNKNTESIEFKNMCGLTIRKGEHIRNKFKPQECAHMPYSKNFSYNECDIYVQTFRSKGMGNDAAPTREGHFEEIYAANSSLTDMELF